MSILRLSSFSFVAVLGASMLSQGCASGAAGEGGVPDLDGTNWCAPETHSRVSVDRFGQVEVKQGKDICLSFTGESGYYIMKIVWWNLAKGIHVEEWATVAVAAARGQLHYVEADPLGDPEFPGIVGSGVVSFTSDDKMRLSQVGHLSNGAAAAFVTVLAQVDELPEITIPITYP